MSMNEIIDAQAEVLGMLMAYPKLMKCCYLVDNHFQGKYKVIFAGVKKSIAGQTSPIHFQQWSSLPGSRRALLKMDR